MRVERVEALNRIDAMPGENGMLVCYLLFILTLSYVILTCMLPCSHPIVPPSATVAYRLDTYLFGSSYRIHVTPELSRFDEPRRCLTPET